VNDLFPVALTCEASKRMLHRHVDHLGAVALEFIARSTGQHQRRLRESCDTIFSSPNRRIP
jgi:hypothetical protein